MSSTSRKHAEPSSRIRTICSASSWSSVQTKWVSPRASRRRCDIRAMPLWPWRNQDDVYCIDDRSVSTTAYVSTGRLLFQGFYRGGRFVFSFKVGPNYPHEPPKVKCETQVYHPNIDLDGNVCLNILREDWKPVLTINSIVYGLQYLFLVCVECYSCQYLQYLVISCT